MLTTSGTPGERAPLQYYVLHQSTGHCRRRSGCVADPDDMRRRSRLRASLTSLTSLTWCLSSMSTQDASARKRRRDLLGLMGSTMDSASGLQQQAALGNGGARVAWQDGQEQGPSSSTVADASPLAPTAPWRFLVTATPPLVLLWGYKLHCPHCSRRSVLAHSWKKNMISDRRLSEVADVLRHCRPGRVVNVTSHAITRRDRQLAPCVAVCGASMHQITPLSERTYYKVSIVRLTREPLNRTSEENGTTLTRACALTWAGTSPTR